MSFIVLEKQLRSLPQELQNSIEMYAIFVINQFKNASKKSEKKSASEIIESLTGILEGQAPLTMKEVRAERLKERYRVC